MPALSAETLNQHLVFSLGLSVHNYAQLSLATSRHHESLELTLTESAAW